MAYLIRCYFLTFPHRHDVETNGIEGVLFVENRGPNFEFGAQHKAFVRYTTDGWATSKDVNAATKSLAAFDALHRYGTHVHLSGWSFCIIIMSVFFNRWFGSCCRFADRTQLCFFLHG